MGPQHPSTHGVLRLMLEIDGETVTEARAGIGYLHTGIEKNMEFRTWTQGVTFCTRMDYVAPLFQEAAYCLAVEKLLGITDDVPERATVIRVLMMELNRITSHLVCLATGGNELGATTIMTVGFTAREEILKIFELITGLRMNHAYIRPGGVAQDIPPGAIDTIREALVMVRKLLQAARRPHAGQPDPAPAAQGRRLPRPAGLHGARHHRAGAARRRACRTTCARRNPYCGYETYDFDVPVADSRRLLGPRSCCALEECYQSMKIVEQTLDRLQKIGPGPVMVADKKVAWPAQMAIGSDGMGNSLDHIREIMGTSMEALIHHFKLVTEGFRVPAGQVFQTVEHPRGELGVHLVSDGGTRPYRAHFRDPSFNNLQAHVDHVRGRAGRRRRRRRRVARPGAGRGGPLMSVETSRTHRTRTTPRRTRASRPTRTRSSPATRRRARRCCRCCTWCSRRTATSARAGSRSARRTWA